jgi:prepilin-type N-terminal cleavage/methylation domain-containing protein
VGQVPPYIFYVVVPFDALRLLRADNQTSAKGGQGCIFVRIMKYEDYWICEMSEKTVVKFWRALRGGFSLVELLVVISVMALLMG